ncbi:hypothetical protein [Pedobacter deserti]|uniref:hypothetical protein n=1 Tax=Pedobacter deserti TaxID=2817382 RepID=UPI00210D731F|nr:hypothetical protein [Pedobacter sp. SYSU D00382]
MNLKILTLLSRYYPANSTLNISEGRYDLQISTDEKGQPSVVRIGKQHTWGRLVNKTYARQEDVNDEGEVIRVRWTLLPPLD